VGWVAFFGGLGRRSSAALACAMASSEVRVMKPCKSGSSASMRARQAWVNSWLEHVPLCSAVSAWMTVRSVNSAIVLSKHRRNAELIVL